MRAEKNFSPQPGQKLIRTAGHRALQQACQSSSPSQWPQLQEQQAFCSFSRSNYLISQTSCVFARRQARRDEKGRYPWGEKGSG